MLLLANSITGSSSSFSAYNDVLKQYNNTVTILYWTHAVRSGGEPPTSGLVARIIGDAGNITSTYITGSVCITHPKTQIQCNHGWLLQTIVIVIVSVSPDQFDHTGWSIWSHTIYIVSWGHTVLASPSLEISFRNIHSCLVTLFHTAIVPPTACLRIKQSH